MNAQGKKASPIGSARQRLSDSVGKRGKRNFNLWFVYGPKVDRDWVLSSDIEVEYFFALEADPNVVNYDLQLEPVLVQIGPDNHRTTFDAKVQYRGTRTEFVEFKWSDHTGNGQDERGSQQAAAQKIWAAEQGATYRLSTELDLFPVKQRIENWRRALPALVRCRGINIEVTKSRAISLLGTRPKTTLAEARDMLPLAEHPHLFATIFSLLQTGKFSSDLDSVPLSLNSIISASTGVS